MVLKILTCFAILFIAFSSSSVHFYNEQFIYQEHNDTKEAQFLLASSNETQTLEGYLLIDSGDPLKLKLKPMNFTEIAGIQEIAWTLNTTVSVINIQLEYRPKLLGIDVDGNNHSFACDPVCNQTLHIEIASNGYFHAVYMDQIWPIDLNQTIEGEKMEDGKEKIHFAFEWSTKNTADFVVTFSHALISPKTGHLDSFNPGNSHNDDKKKPKPSTWWIWFVMIFAFAVFGVLTTFLCVRCRLAPSRHPQRYAIPTVSFSDE